MKKYFILICCMLIMLGLSGCTIYLKDSSEGLNHVKEVQIAKEESYDEVVVNLEMGVGDLKVIGGGDDALYGHFEYTSKNWEPNIEEKTIGSKKNITIKQPSVSISNLSNETYKWNITAVKDLPLTFKLDSGVGRSEIDLQNTKLEELDIKMGVGEVILDLSDKYENDVDVNIQGGIGSLVVKLPKDMGVKADVSGGIKSIKANDFIIKDDMLQNEAYDKNSKNINIKIEAGIGNIVLEIEE